jgi:uncharacterized FlaG/YvyC family protein
MHDSLDSSSFRVDPPAISSEEPPEEVAEERTPRRQTSKIKSRDEPLDNEEKLLRAVQRIESMLEVFLRQSLRPVLDKEFEDATARAIYEATGDKTVREIAQEVGVGIATVSRTWSRFEGLGLVIKDGSRYKRIF